MSLSFARLIACAEKAIEREQARLPESVRNLAGKVPVIFHRRPSREILEEDFEDDILGLFVGESYADEPGLAPGAPTQILLFLENIYDAAEGDLGRFDEEVVLTYLHELGHYLGWDEDDLEERGLG